MASTPTRARPLSPHLSIWKWGPHMAVSIAHRVTGTCMALVGASLFVWWLAAAASGADSYATFSRYVIDDAGAGGLAGVTTVLAQIVAIGLTWAFFQHMFSGIRHLVLDTGAGYELRRNKLGAIAVFAAAATVTILIWAGIVVGRMA